jgi:hypothetical protein
VTQHQLHDVRTLLRGRCPRCSFEQLRGHRCSCPVKVAVRNLSRLTGSVKDTSLDDDDLLVEQAVRKLIGTYYAPAPISDESLKIVLREIVREAVDGAVQFGRRASQ